MSNGNFWLNRTEIYIYETTYTRNITYIESRQARHMEMWKRNNSRF